MILPHAIDPDEHFNCGLSNESGKREHEGLVSCNSKSVDGTCDLKSAKLSSSEKCSTSDRHHRRERRPDIQRYVPKPKQVLPLSSGGHSASSAANFAGQSTSLQNECASDSASSENQNNAASQNSRANVATANVSKTGERGNNSYQLAPSQKSERVTAAVSCGLQDLSSSSLPDSVVAAMSSASITDKHESASGVMHDKVTRGVRDLKKSYTKETKRMPAESSITASGKTGNDRRGKAGSSIRTKELDWDSDDDFACALDGMRWGDLPPPSDHDWSDAESYDDSCNPGKSATNNEEQKSYKLRRRRRRAKKKPMAADSELEGVEYTAAEGKQLTTSSGNSSARGSAELKKFNSVVFTSSRPVEDHIPPAHVEDIPLSKSDSIDANGHNSVRAYTKSYSHSRYRRDAAEGIQVADRNKSRQKAESRESRNNSENADKRAAATASKELEVKWEPNSERTGSTRVGGIIRLPVGTVTTTSQDMAHSVQPRTSTSTHGRHRWSTHGRHRALWGPADPESSSSAVQHQGSPEEAKPGPTYQSNYALYYQRPSPSQQLYYSENLPVGGTSHMLPGDSFVYGYTQMSYDGRGGYVDDPYYH